MKKPFKYWNNKENCRAEALKYNKLFDFKMKSNGAYSSSLRNGWHNELTSHMIKVGNRYNKCVYAYEFQDKSVYVGITYNIEKRIRDRNKCSTDSVTIHIKKTQQIPNLIQLTEYILVDIAVQLESDYVNKYRNEGWNILNKAKTGSVGSVKKWTKEKCSKVAQMFDNRTAFMKTHSGAYQSASINGWLDEICFHMIQKVKPHNYWTKEMCRKEFLRYNKKNDVKLNSPTAYSIACKNKWTDEFSEHMMNGRKKNGYWTIERCLSTASKYKTRGDFRKKCGSVYSIAHRKGWLNYIYLNCNI